MTNSRTAWGVVAAGALITWMAMGALLSLPVFLAPMSADTGWSRGGIGLAMTLNFLSMGVASFVWGGLSDRYGPRTILTAGVVLLGIGLALASRSTSLLEFQLIYGGLIGVAVLQTLIEHNVAGNVAVLGASLTTGTPAVSERL